MITVYCPSCWNEVPQKTEFCPYCGFEIAQDQTRTFEEKLLQALEHPVPEKRLLAIQILGDLGSRAALPAFERLLNDPQADVFELREALAAVKKIQSPHSLELIRLARDHPYPTIRRLAERLLNELESE